MEKLVLIDGHSILNRAFYGVPDLTNSEGVHTNAVYGFLNIMFKILDEEKPEYLIVAFDLSAPTFRHKMYEGYKGTRKPMPEELRQQVPIIREVLEAMNVITVSLEGFEADDLLGTLGKRGEKAGLLVSIVSGDRDILQIATDNIKIRIPKTRKGVTQIEDYNAKEVLESYGVTPTQFIDMKALMGDASDNIPGAPGIGEKTAGAIIKTYGSIENAYAHVQDITPTKARNSLGENYARVQLSKELATINVDAPLECDIKHAVIDGMFNKNAYGLFKKYNFKSMLKRFESTEAKNASKRDLSEVTANFRVLEGADELEGVISSAGSDTKYIGVFPVCSQGTLYGMGLSYGDDTTVFISAGEAVTEGKLLQSLKKLTDCGHKLVFLNLKDCLLALGQDFLEIEKNMLVDVGLGAYLLNPLKESYAYEELAQDYLGVTMLSRQELIGKKTIAECAFVDAPELKTMAMLAAYSIDHSWREIEAKLFEKNMKRLFDEIEMPLVFVLYGMEREGVLVDRDALAAYGEQLGVKIRVLETEIYDLAGENFNINSPKQLGTLLFEKLGLPASKKTKSGYSTAADVLEKLAADYPIVGKILEYRQLAKLKSTYADGLAECIGVDGRIHTRFNQTITATGRISSTEPNLQNIPVRMEIGRQIRKVFIPKPGCIFLDADYSQIELRLLAHMSGDEKLIEAYGQAQDIHAITASQVFKTPLPEVTKEMRSNAKAVNFGIIYGISSFGLSQDLSISRKQAQEYIDQYFVTYPKIKDFLDGLVKSAGKNGYAITMYDRRRPVPELSNSNYMQRQFGERIAMNSPIQGSAADIIKIAMINVDRALKENGLKSRLILQVHDELLVETYEDEVEQVKRMLHDNMVNAARLKVELEAEVGEGNNWLEAH